MQVEMRDISYQVYGKYVHCTMHDGLWWSDDDFGNGCGVGELKKGAIPSPYQRTPELDARAAEITAAGGWRGTSSGTSIGEPSVTAVMIGVGVAAVLAVILMVLVRS